MNVNMFSSIYSSSWPGAKCCSTMWILLMSSSASAASPLRWSRAAAGYLLASSKVFKSYWRLGKELSFSFIFLLTFFFSTFPVSAASPALLSRIDSSILAFSIYFATSCISSPLNAFRFLSWFISSSLTLIPGKIFRFSCLKKGFSATYRLFRWLSPLSLLRKSS